MIFIDINNTKSGYERAANVIGDTAGCGDRDQIGEFGTPLEVTESMYLEELDTIVTAKRKLTRKQPKLIFQMALFVPTNIPLMNYEKKANIKQRRNDLCPAE